jgi:hypothetical protein
VILLGNLLGSVRYFVIGRPHQATVLDTPPAGATTDRAHAAADLLYGPDKRP